MQLSSSSSSRNTLMTTVVVVVIVAMMATSTNAFVSPSASSIKPFGMSCTTMNMVDPSTVLSSSSTQLAVETLDPTTVLTQGLGGIINSPAILLVPIVAALGVASLLAWLIVAYANPQVEDDDEL